VKFRPVDRAPEGSALHEQIERALDRAARAQEHSHALIAECRRASLALHETIAAQRRDDTGAGADTPQTSGSETDS
jgi:hypothetical protein